MAGFKVTRLGPPRVARNTIIVGGVVYEAADLAPLTVEDEGTPLATAASTLDFVGAGVTASGTGATKTITIPGGSGLTVEDEGTPLATDATTLDFVGAGVTASGAGATKTITISGGSGITVEDEGSPLATSADTLDFVGAGVTATGAGTTKTITIPGGSGSGLALPNVVQVAGAGNNVTSVTIAAAASGNRLVMLTNSTTGQVTSPACTNVTWTQVTTHSTPGAFIAIWVGVVAGGSSGTTVTMTMPGSFNTVVILEVTDALTPTLGANTSRSIAAINAVGLSSVLNVARLSGATAGRFVAFASTVDNTTLLMRMHPSIPVSGVVDMTANCLAVGYVVGTVLTMQDNPGGVGGQIIAEIT